MMTAFMLLLKGDKMKNKLKMLGLAAIIGALSVGCQDNQRQTSIENAYSVQVGSKNYKFADINNDGSIDAIKSKMFGHYVVEWIKPEFKESGYFLSSNATIKDRLIVPKKLDEDLQNKADSLVSALKNFENQLSNYETK